jgi:hypothetical protein
MIDVFIYMIDTPSKIKVDPDIACVKLTLRIS